MAMYTLGISLTSSRFSHTEDNAHSKKKALKIFGVAYGKSRKNLTLPKRVG